MATTGRKPAEGGKKPVEKSVQDSFLERILHSIFPKTVFQASASTAARTATAAPHAAPHASVQPASQATPPIAVGERLYINPADFAFVQRIESWLNYLKVADLFPGTNDLAGKIYELAGNLRSAGNASFYGIEDAAVNLMLVRPGDYTAALHEATHLNPKLKNSLLSSEAGAFAAQIFAAGDFDGVIGILHGSESYKHADKRAGTLLAEASLVLGRKLFDVFKSLPPDESLPSLAVKVREEAQKLAGEMAFKKKSARDYLTEVHGLTSPVADYLLNITGDTAQSIVTSTSQAKKDVIGAFKALASFYHVNLGYSLEQAVARTEEHFRNDEALTLHKILMTGAKDAFAKMQEYGYPPEACNALSEMMLSQGASGAVSYARGIPNLLELFGQYGPNGTRLLADVLRKPNLFDALASTSLSRELLRLAKERPDDVRTLIAEMMSYEWDAPITVDPGMSFDLRSIYDHIPLNTPLSGQDVSKIAGWAIYLTSVGKTEKTMAVLANVCKQEGVPLGDIQCRLDGKNYANYMAEDMFRWKDPVRFIAAFRTLYSATQAQPSAPPVADNPSQAQKK